MVVRDQKRRGFGGHRPSRGGSERQRQYGTTAQGNPSISTPIILNNSQTWFVDASRTLTINGAVSGSGKSLTKSGAGTLKLNAASTHDGNTIVLAGTMALGQELPLPNTSGILLADPLLLNVPIEPGKLQKFLRVWVY